MHNGRRFFQSSLQTTHPPLYQRLGLQKFFLLIRLLLHLRLWHPHHQIGHPVGLALQGIVRAADPQLRLERGSIDSQPLFTPALGTFAGRAGIAAAGAFALEYARAGGWYGGRRFGLLRCLILHRCELP